MEASVEITKIREVESLEAILDIAKEQRSKFSFSMKDKYAEHVRKGKKAFYKDLNRMVARYEKSNEFRKKLDEAYALKKDRNTKSYKTQDILDRIQAMNVLDWASKGSIERVEGWLYYLQ